MLHHLWKAAAALALVAAPAVAQDADGAAIFEETCSGCHGADSELSVAAMAGLDEEAFAEAMSGHPEVGGVADLTEEDITALQAYVSEQGDG